jgi:hypothetical protein
MQATGALAQFSVSAIDFDRKGKPTCQRR